MSSFSSAGDSHIGSRGGQEDSFAIWQGVTGEGEQEFLMVVADGMGGHARGDIASALATEAFVACFSHSSDAPPIRLRNALFEANARLARAVTEAPEMAGMGTTLAACHVRGMSLHWISVGDSPLWLCRTSGLERLNADHSMRAELKGAVERGEMTDWAAGLDPYGNMLRAAVMGEEIEEIDCPATPISCRPDDMVILASDGILTVPEDILHQTATAHWDQAPAQIVEVLLRIVIDTGARRQDNTTVLVGKFASAARPTTGEKPSRMPTGKMTMGAWAVLGILGIAALSILAVVVAT